MIGGMKSDFLISGSESWSGGPKGAKAVGKKADFEALFARESERDRSEVNAAQASPLLSKDSRPVATPDVSSAGEKQATVKMLSTMRAEQSATRQKAMENFMTSMKDELGIEPERILQAFSQLDGEALVASPEVSAQDFIANLQLAPEQEARAGDLYHEMLKVTNEAALSEKLVGLGSDVKFDVISARDQSLRELNQSIDGLNNAFAMRGQAGMKMADGAMAPSSAVDAEKARMAIEKMDAQLVQMMQNRLSKEKSPESEGMTLGMAGAAGGLASVEGEIPEGFAKMMTSPGEIGATALDTGIQAGPLAGNMNLSNQMSSEGDSSNLFSEGSAGKDVKKSGLGAKGDAASIEAGGEFSLDSNMAAGAVGGSESKGAQVLSGPAGMMIERPLATPQDEQENMRELMRQSQLVLKQGGGEIKMDLKPEGMGQVRLKISVDDGQVNVQMLTESDAAKRLLEKGLNELRADLTAQNLKVESMKVDIGREMQRHMDQQADEQARQQARQFMSDMMGQFRDERNAFQQGFMENPGWRQYNQGRGMRMNPEQVDTVGSAGARSRAKSAGRLDLVA